MEALVAMLVLGLMVAALLSGLGWCTFSVRLAREDLRATQIMVEKMEVIRLLSWDQVTSNNVIPATFTAPYYSNGASNSNGGLTYSGTIAIVPANSAQLGGALYSGDIRVVAVQVAWTNQRTPHKRQLTSYISRYGIQNYTLN
jgi:hypothetical protein